MPSKPSPPLPSREAVDAAIAVAAATMTQGARANLDIRLYGALASDRIERIGIGCRMHRDAGARTAFEIVEPAKDAEWAGSCRRHMAALTAEAERLDRRRSSFDPDGAGISAPRWAWDIHPTAASILSLYPRLPALDGSHRIDGEHGRIVELQDAPGLESATIAYGDGIVRIVEARFPNGSTLTTSSGWVKLRMAMTLPDVIKGSLRGRPAGTIAEQLGRGAKAGMGRIAKVQTVDDALEITLADVLVPWDQRRRGDEDWRTRHMRFGKEPGGRHG